MKKDWLWKRKREEKFTLHFNIRRHLKNICAIYVECCRKNIEYLRNPTTGYLNLYQFGYFSILEVFPRLVFKVSFENRIFIFAWEFSSFSKIVFMNRKYFNFMLYILINSNLHYFIWNYINKQKDIYIVFIYINRYIFIEYINLRILCLKLRGLHDFQIWDKIWN